MIKITVQLHCYRKHLTTSWNNPAHPSLSSSLFQTLSATRHTLCLLSCFFLPSFVRYIHHPSSARLKRLSLAPLTFVSKLSLMYWCPILYLPLPPELSSSPLLYTSCCLDGWLQLFTPLHSHTYVFFCFLLLLTFIPLHLLYFYTSTFPDALPAPYSHY